MAAKSRRRPTDEIEIVGLSGSSMGGRRKPLTKSSRRQELRCETVRLRHVPSGKEMLVEIPFGRYSKREMQRLREEAKVKFLTALRRGTE
jgi:hypothetical protein